MGEIQLPLSEDFKKEKETELLPVQERTFRIYKPFIRCATCVKNIDMQKMQRGFFSKTFCNVFKEKRPDQYLADYDITQDRIKAQHCPHYLPEMGTLVDLSYVKPFEIVEDFIEVDKDHADELNKIFAYKKEN